MAKPSLHVIPGTAPADTPAQRVRDRVKAMPKPSVMIQCRRCGGREVIETRIGVESIGGKTRGGTKALICAACLMQGQRIVVN